MSHDLGVIRSCYDCAHADTWTEYGQNMFDCTRYEELPPEEQDAYLESASGEFAINCKLFERVQEEG